MLTIISFPDYVCVFLSFPKLTYSLIRGPGTVGIDANPPLTEVVTTVLEALDFYGVYRISRRIKIASDASLSSTAGTSDSEVEAATAATAEGSLGPSERSHSKLAHSINSAGKQADHQSVSTSSDYFYAYEAENDRPNTSTAAYASVAQEVIMPDFSSEPELPDVMITDRRISMGVYGMFSKF